MKPVSTSPITVGTDNVLNDLGFCDAAEMTVKARLALQIMRTVRQNGWTQKETAERVGLKQPDVSNIMNSQLDGISLDRLFVVLNRLGYDVEVRVAAAAHEDARTLVVA